MNSTKWYGSIILPPRPDVHRPVGMGEFLLLTTMFFLIIVAGVAIGTALHFSWGW